jgi:hypothetical protein
MRKTTINPTTRHEENAGNDGPVETVEAKSRLSPLSTSPLEIPPTASGIPTFPTVPATKLMGKWKTKDRFPTFPQPRISLTLNGKNKKQRRASALAE